jgi:AraC family transcriptional regulator
MQIIRRTLFESDLMRLGHVVARPPASRSQPLEHQDCNVLVLPLAGLFAKHDGPRRQVIGTPNHGVFIEAGKPYRITYPAGLGDECLTIRFPTAALPVAAQSHALLPPALMLARSLLWRKLEADACDPLEVEELALGVLVAVLDAARTPGRGKPAKRKQQAERIKEVGESVYRYVLRARLAKSLDAVLDGADLTATALESGFSSHSHLTARFRSLFGVTPAQLRQAAGSRTLAELRKIVTAGTFVQH